MDFDHSERAQHLITQVERFMREQILPNEQLYYDQLVNSNDFRQWRIPPIMEELKKRKMEDVIVVAGGIIPENDQPALKKIGVKAVFGPGTPTPDIIDYIKKSIAA